MEVGGWENLLLLFYVFSHCGNDVMKKYSDNFRHYSFKCVRVLKTFAEYMEVVLCSFQEMRIICGILSREGGLQNSILQQ